MSDALIVPLAVGTGVVVIVVAVAVVLVVLLVTMSMRGRQRRGTQRRSGARQTLGHVHDRADRAERDRDIAPEEPQGRIDPDR